MGTFRAMHRQAYKMPRTYSIGTYYFGKETRYDKEHSEVQIPVSAFSRIEQSEDIGSHNIEDFFKGLSSEARRDFESQVDLFQCESDTVLFTVAQAPSKVLF